MNKISTLIGFITLCFLSVSSLAQRGRTTENFNAHWSFNLGEVANGQNPELEDSQWRILNLPHDWSIEGEFNKENPATVQGGALPGGIGWYRKIFTLGENEKGRQVYIQFDGIYQKSTIWINGHYLGFRPNGYISFQYDLTPFINLGGKKNVMAVRVDNSSQPNSRWYSGSGIFRNVWLVSTNPIAVNHWGTYVNTPTVSPLEAEVVLKTSIKNKSGKTQSVTLVSEIYNSKAQKIGQNLSQIELKDSLTSITQKFRVLHPDLWSVDTPILYQIQSRILKGNTLLDQYTTPLGLRYFNFDIDQGFSLNGIPMKINGVCEHHDLGALGSAFNIHALERQFKILKEMGVNALRTSHNPPAPEFLDLADRMGFVVMDEAFDVWEVAKSPQYDYHLFFKDWHQKDLEDQVLRDRNHPSVIIWSIGNEIPEQSSPAAFPLAKELSAIIHNLDSTRPITAANDNPGTSNQIIQSGAVDLVGYNYHHQDLPSFQKRYPGKKFIGTETVSALESRGVYNTQTDSVDRWPPTIVQFGKYKSRGPMNTDQTVNAYDNISAPWGSTHEEAWKVYKKYPFLSGQFIWTGFDYIGEPWPYGWPSRSSYFGIIDLAGFPKDVYYMYQSEWTKKPVLHIFPHWNWEPGKMVDVWAYYNQADEVELFLNGTSQGTKHKQGDDLHIHWLVKYAPGVLKAVSRNAGKTVLTTEIRTAGPARQIELIPDKNVLNSDGSDLSFITVRILDQEGNLVPNADYEITFNLSGEAKLVGVDNGCQTSHESPKGHHIKTFNGLALAIIQSSISTGKTIVTAESEGLAKASIPIFSKGLTKE